MKEGGFDGLPRPWWEAGRLQQCRDAAAMPPCREERTEELSCTTTTDEDGEPVRRCVKILRHYINCKGM